MKDKNKLGDYIRSLIEEEKRTHKRQLWKFYKSPEFIKVKTEVLEEQHHECFYCKQKGIIKRYDNNSDDKPRLIQTVHHVKYVKQFPELALDKTYIDEYGNEQKNLVCVCKVCHNKVHGRYSGKKVETEEFNNIERW